MRATDSTVGLDAGLCDVDVDAFKHDSIAPGTSAITLDTLARASCAVGLYRGDLLEDWDIEWCRLEREQLRQRFVFTLRTLAEGFERIHRYDLALQYARRATEGDPADEPAQRALIRLLFRTGDKTSAANQFRRFADYAKAELGVEPDSQTRALFRRIKEASFPNQLDESVATGTPPIRAEMIPLVGRAEERRQMGVLLDAAMAGNGGGVFILGDAGVGKSRLIKWAMEEWAARGGLTACGRCIEFNDPIPYQPIFDAIGSVTDITGITGFADRDSGGLTSAFLDVAASSTVSVNKRPHTSLSPAKLRLFGWLLARLEKVGRHRPLLMVIEDLQWIDASSVDFLAYLLERAKSMRLLALVTSRPGGTKNRRAMSTDRLSRYCAAMIRLRPLSPAESAELVQVLIDAPSSPSQLSAAIYQETEGNPLFIVETIRLLVQQGKVSGNVIPTQSLGDPRALTMGPRMPDGVRSAVEQRLQLIDPAALRVARIAAVLGRSFDEELLSLVVGTGANRLSRAIGRLMRACIFEREDTGYRFAHDKIRAACYEDLPVRLRKLYHARAAAALVQVPDVAIHSLAWHQHCAGQWNLASTSWEVAGDHAKRIHAHEEALRAYSHAISCNRRDSEDGQLGEARILVKCDEVLEGLGRLEERRAVLDRLGALSRQVAPNSLMATWLVRRAVFEEHTANFRAAVALARKAWYTAGIACDAPTEFEALRVLAWALNHEGRLHRSLAVCRLALKKMAGRKSRSLVYALWQAANTSIVLGDFVRASSYIERAMTITTELELSEVRPFVVFVRAMLDKWIGRVDASRSGLLEVLRFAKDYGNPVIGARATLHLATVEAHQGKLGNAIRRLREALVASRSIGYLRSHIGCLNEVANGIGRLIGSYGWAWNASEHALSMSKASDKQLIWAMCRDSQAMLLLDEGRDRDAAGVMDEVLEVVGQKRASFGPPQEYLARRGVTNLRLGELTKAVADLEFARSTQARVDVRLVLVDTVSHLAMAYAKLENAERAISTSKEALHLLAEMDYANMQPQRIFWHHYKILEMFDRKPRLQYLKRAVEFIEAQASTLSKAQARRFRRDVCLNREILEAWERHKQEFQPEGRDETTTTSALAPVTPVSVSPVI